MSDSLERFQSYDFDSNKEWQSYRLNIEIPPGKAVDQILVKYKAKWYKENVEPEFDVSQVIRRGVSATAKDDGPSTSTSGVESKGRTAYQPARYRPSKGAVSFGGLSEVADAVVLMGIHIMASDARARTSAEAAPSPAAAAAGATRREGSRGAAGQAPAVLALLHTMVLLFAAAYFFPFLSRRLNYMSYRLLLTSAIAAHAYKVYLRHGAPQVRPFAGLLGRAKAWAAEALGTSDVHYATMMLLMLSSRIPMSTAVVPSVILAAYHTAAYASSMRARLPAALQPRLDQAQAFLAAKRNDALLLNAFCEIGTGFLLIALLVTAFRNLSLMLVYWHLLRLRYICPDSRAYHAKESARDCPDCDNKEDMTPDVESEPAASSVWSQVDHFTRPYLARVPMAMTAVSYIQRWFRQGS